MIVMHGSVTLNMILVLGLICSFQAATTEISLTLMTVFLLHNTYQCGRH